MRQLCWASVAVCLVVLGCQQSRPVVPAANATGDAESPTISAADKEASVSTEDAPVRSGDFIIGEPVRYENLAVFPIRTQVVKSDDRFITLDEGLNAGTVEVMEVGLRRAANASAELADVDPFGDVAGDNLVGDVNHLQVVNRSDKPLYLMPGEIIVGGKQDRCIGSETIVEANGEPVSVEVYCVEHGRWHQRDSAEFAALATAFVADIDEEKLAELAHEAASGKFVASAGNLSKKARYSAQSGEGQGRVWEEVGVANSLNGALMVSDAFTSNYAQQDVREKLDPYIEHLQGPVAEVDQVVGVVVAINGKMEIVDVYESTPLFKKLWPKLLKGYALDAIAVTGENDATQVCDVADAKAFLDKAREADVEKTDEKGGLVVTARSSPDVTSFSAGMGGMGGAFGGGIHSAGYGR
jgi:hypothetical protein